MAVAAEKVFWETGNRYQRSGTTLPKKTATSQSPLEVGLFIHHP